MKIPLDKFEHIINETILERGLSYFKKGYVTELSEISNGKYEALVTGTEEYTVQIGINNNIITEHKYSQIIKLCYLLSLQNNI